MELSRTVRSPKGIVNAASTGVSGPCFCTLLTHPGCPGDRLCVGSPINSPKGNLLRATGTPGAGARFTLEVGNEAFATPSSRARFRRVLGLGLPGVGVRQQRDCVRRVLEDD